MLSDLLVAIVLPVVLRVYFIDYCSFFTLVAFKTLLIFSNESCFQKMDISYTWYTTYKIMHTCCLLLIHTQ